MYSYADRLRAVELYLKLGKRVKATIRQLGYPTKNALKSWYREYEQHLDVRVRSVARAPKFSEAEKQAALDHYRTHDRCISSTMRALGYPGRGTLTAWVREAFPEARTSMTGRSWRPAYPEALKQVGVIGLCSGEESGQQVADRLGVCRPTLYNWRNQLLGHEAASSMKRRKTSAPAREREELERQLEALQRDVRQLQLEHDLLKKANELLKKGLGVDLQLLSNREKTQLVDALKDIYRLPELLVQLGIARSSYFYHRARANLEDKYVTIRRSLAEIFESNHRCYGYRRLQASLARQSVTISEKVVQRLMKQECLVAARPRRRRFGSYLGEISPAPENLINRDFHAKTPNEKWLTDITEFQIPAGKVYLSPIIDCFDGMVISWSIGTQPDAGLVNTMLDAAIDTVTDAEGGTIVHSDRGAHYRWPGWLTRISDAKLVRSMSRKGCSQDNAACEGFFGRLKTELFYPRDWKSITIEQFVREVDAYIRWYNEKRIKLSLGSRSPVEYRESLGLTV
ncbi:MULTISPECIES: IS3 family transposase [Rhizobium]|uniref:Transposase InsO family protein/transposase-like protein n=1 Tax=Rhizobium tropici TaxID=398 RepID=A0ABR6R9V6_RHITR|nr:MULTISPECIES: IS3 family transposase [Rhizobium]AGB70309.1 putative IS3 family transposase, IS150 group, OrfAB [Rhizobium tropici CIAT 899]AGB73934.1 putative IS3 family transposase, IS150 group, OrfAB [Rhizobium tropici CIAT 899]MBB4245624.1 transposase InsO family protein/transposase-like protein [Rhizobium tropici]MBB5596904.1 transposase InsO family protein/transposase-like protein [Rhizobium tropici]MBB6495959.1 transposase InsO family protein/transposase-like protein [Rhizobium tropic